MIAAPASNAPPEIDAIRDKAKLITLAEAAELIPNPRNPRKQFHVNTISAWCVRGLRGVKLPSTRLGAGRVTTLECVEWFIRQTQDPEIRKVTTEKLRKERSRRAKAELKRRGY